MGKKRGEGAALAVHSSRENVRWSSSSATTLLSSFPNRNAGSFESDDASSLTLSLPP